MIERATAQRAQDPRGLSEDGRRPALTVIEGGGGARRTRATVVVALLASLVVALAWSRIGAVAEPERPLIGGTATVAPGETLWDVAVAHTPAGSDPRGYLQRLRAVNGLAPGEVAPWTVVVLPAE